MKLPMNWKNRSKEHKALWFASGRTGAKQIGDYNGTDFVDVWVPTVRGQVVQCPLTKKSKFCGKLEAVMAAVRFRELCRNIANTKLRGDHERK